MRRERDVSRKDSIFLIGNYRGQQTTGQYFQNAVERGGEKKNLSDENSKVFSQWLRLCISIDFPTFFRNRYCSLTERMGGCLKLGTC